MQPIFGTSLRVFYIVSQDYCWRLALRRRDRPLPLGVLHLVRATRPARIGPITPFLCVSQLVISDEVESAIGGWGMSEITVLPECSEEAAQWILERRLEYWSLPGQRTPVCGVVPTEFESYCRLLHPALRVSNGHAVGVRWENLARELGVELQGGTAWEDLASGDAAFSGLWHQAPRIGSLPKEEVTVLVDLLRPPTGTGEECTFAVWEGYGGSDLDRQRPGAARLRLPGRTYVLLKGAIEAATVSYDVPEPGLPTFDQSANIWWPGDVAWCVATDIDLCWTYVGASRQCIDQIIADPRLEDRKSTRLNSSHTVISYAVFCLKKKKRQRRSQRSENADHR